MGDDPVGALIGTVLIALGSLILYGAIKNRKVFGQNGILPTALTTGSITDLSKVPQAFPNFLADAVSGAQEEFGKVLKKGTKSGTAPDPEALRQAIANIAQKGTASLANNIADEIDKFQANPDVDLSRLRHLLTIADMMGLKVDADQIRQYVKEVSGATV